MFCFFWEYTNYVQASLILSGRCTPVRFEYFLMPQMFIRSSSACIKIQAKSKQNHPEMFTFHQMNSVCESDILPHALYAFSFYSHIWTTSNSEVRGIRSECLQNSSELGQQDHFP